MSKQTQTYRMTITQKYHAEKTIDVEAVDFAGAKAAVQQMVDDGEIEFDEMPLAYPDVHIEGGLKNPVTLYTVTITRDGEDEPFVSTFHSWGRRDLFVRQLRELSDRLYERDGYCPFTWQADDCGLDSDVYLDVLHELYDADAKEEATAHD